MGDLEYPLTETKMYKKMLEDIKNHFLIYIENDAKLIFIYYYQKYLKNGSESKLRISTLKAWKKKWKCLPLTDLIFMLNKFQMEMNN